MSLILVIQQAFEVLGHLTEACGVNRGVPRREWGRLHWGRRFPIEFPVHPGAAPNGRHAEGHTADTIQRLQCLRSYHAHPNHPPERVGHSPSAPSRAPRIRVRSSRGGAQTRWQEARREWWAELETYQNWLYLFITISPITLSFWCQPPIFMSNSQSCQWNKLPSIGWIPMFGCLNHRILLSRGSQINQTVFPESYVHVSWCFPHILSSFSCHMVPLCCFYPGAHW